MTAEGGWKPKDVFNQASRRAKASKLVNLISRYRPLEGTRLLEIGTGGGTITSLLAEHTGNTGEVWSVDVEDMRVDTAGYNFKLVDGATVPFEDDSFDIVVSNHTIEHVGGPDDQLIHLREIARTLRSGGLGYLASPSRWALIEPHFRVPMLSWLPVGQRDRALRLSRRGEVYDISPRTRPEIRDLMSQAGLSARDITLDAVREAARTEDGPLVRMAGSLPQPALQAARGAFPTMIFLVEHDHRSG